MLDQYVIPHPVQHNYTPLGCMVSSAWKHCEMKPNQYKCRNNMCLPLRIRHGVNVLGTHVLEYKISGTRTLLVLAVFHGLVFVLILVLRTKCTRTFHEYHTSTPYCIFHYIINSLLVRCSHEFQFLLSLLRKTYIIDFICLH